MVTIGANSLELFETSKESERTNGERSHSAMRENSTVYGHSDRTYATSRAYDRSPRKENTFQGLGIKDSSEHSRFTFYVSRILFRSNYYARVRSMRRRIRIQSDSKLGFTWNVRAFSRWKLFRWALPIERHTLETTWLHATVGRIDRDTRTVLETRRKRKRSRVLGKWFARACRARDIEDRSLRASSSRCETRLVRSLSHPTIQSIFPLFKRIVPAFIFLKVRFKTERRRLLVTREKLRKRLFFWCDLLSFSRKICESRVLFVEKCTKGSLIHGTDNGWVEVYEANRLTFRS